MIEAEVEFDPAAGPEVLAILLELPVALRPTLYGFGEDEINRTIGDGGEIGNIAKRVGAGFMLRNSSVTFDIRPVKLGTMACTAYFEEEPSGVEQFLVGMAEAVPNFGFACLHEERDAKNKVFAKYGINSIESWVGRDTARYIPGLYWWTLLSASLMEKHQVPLSSLEQVAIEHRVLDRDIHLFRFYDRPEDWRSAKGVADLCASLPGVFNIDKVAREVEVAPDFARMRAVTREWR